MSTPAHVRIPDLPVVLEFKRGERSLREVSEASGVSASTLSRIERGDVGEPTLSTLEHLAAWLDRPILIEP